MLAHHEVYREVSEDRQRLKVSTQWPDDFSIKDTQNRLDSLFPEKSARLPLALGLLYLANAADLGTTIIGIEKGANEVNPLANALFGWMGLTPGIIILKTLLLLVITIGAKKLWKTGNRNTRMTVMSILWCAIGIYTMVAINNYNMITVLDALS